MPQPRSVQPLRGRWQARLPAQPWVQKQRGQQGVKQQVRLPLEPMGPQQVGTFF